MARRRNKNQRRTISLKFNLVKDIDGFEINVSTGKFSARYKGETIENAVDGGHVEISYDRKKTNKSKKTILKIPQFGPNLFKSPLAFLWHYDVIFAIDTNTKIISGCRYSVGAMAILQILEKNISDGGISDSAKMNMNMFGALLHGKNITSKVENWFWKTAIEEGIKKLWEGYCTSKVIGLVVDSDLANLDSYNARILPIFKDYYLPENIYLIYASTDSGKDLVLNQLIGLCDKESNLQLNEIANGRPPSSTVFTELNQEKLISMPGVPFRFHPE